ncbi:MAG: hypothetical protein U1E73_09715 [Planctomycetota bacterium]
MTTAIDYAAHVSGIRILGVGSVTRSSIRLTLRSRDAPLDFHPAWLFGCGVDLLVAVAAGLVGKPVDGPVAARTRADFLGEGGSELGSLIVLSTLECRRARLNCRVQVSRYRLATEIGERPTALAERTILAATQPSEVLALGGAGMVSTSRGRDWCSIVSTWIQGNSTIVNRSLNLLACSIESSGVSSACTFTFDSLPASADGRRQRG